MDLSIIIINWNSAAYLRTCLVSIATHTEEITFEVIVVDNASHDGCEKLLREEFPEVHFVQSHENLGFGRANNLAFRYSSGKILLFLNPDTEILDGAIQKMVAFLRSDYHAGAVGAVLLNTDGTVQSSCVQAFPTITNQVLDSELLRGLFPGWSGWGLRPLRAGAERTINVDVISGAGFMVKRSVFEQVGMFASEYFMYADDVELSYKIKKAGYAVVCHTDCRITHLGGRSSASQVDHFTEILQRESMAQFFLRTRGRMYAALYRAAMAGAAALRLALILCLAPLGGIRLNGKTAASRLTKWSRIFRWAVGIHNVEAGRRPNVVTQQ